MPTNKIPEEPIPNEYPFAKLAADLLSKDADSVTEAKKESRIAMINVHSSFWQFIDKIVPLILLILALPAIIILFVYTFYLVIDFEKLNAFLNMAWKTITCGSPFALSFILLHRYKK